jgi:aspartate-semialdehyde dehydrogenase
MPKAAKDLEVLPTDPSGLDVPLVFSALPSDTAKEKEPLFAGAGMAVCTNAGAFRREQDVPVLLPEVNPDHCELIRYQREARGWSGFIATNPNCTSTGATIALKALDEAFGLEKVFAVSLQAISGAGYPGVASLDIVDNVVPYIANEEPKFEWEPRKMMGKLNGGTVELAPFQMSSHTNRVPVSDGHLVCLTLAFKKSPSPGQAGEALADYQAPRESSNLPSTPRPVIEVKNAADRPQPRLDRLAGNGMTTVVGRIREDTILDLRLLVLSHNTIRGAAGGSIYNAELLTRLGYVKA